MGDQNNTDDNKIYIRVPRTRRPVTHAKIFSVNESLIRRSSDFIDELLKDPERQRINRTVELPHAYYDTFPLYHNWLLTGQLHTNIKLDRMANTYKVDWPPEPRSEGYSALKGYTIKQDMFELGSLSRLGHHLQDENFNNILGDAWIDCLRWHQSYNHSCNWMATLYNELPGESPTSRVLIDFMETIEPWVLIPFVSLPHIKKALVVSILVAMLRKMPDGVLVWPKEGEERSCKYHYHDKCNPCYGNASGE
ncbi:hypothetical protein GQ44DRAFT_728047 [Phaeosphaeriaceae sp. PMI808]|nr:hypothetical protein GQ44DRAFT_728047 [Phaeosphaeriaceae sp. PMI808]